MRYGDIYAKIPVSVLRELFQVNLFLLNLGRLYFKIFGYPDIASHGRFPIVYNLLKPKKGEKIFDAGCGNGIYANMFAYYFGCRVTGWDLDDKKLRIAQRIADYFHNHVNFYKKDLEKDAFPKGLFDKVICLEVIEHIKNDNQLLNNFNKITKKGSLLIISTAKKENLTKDEEKSRYQKVKKGTHVRSGYELGELKDKLVKAGFKPKVCFPYYRSFSRIVIKIQHQIYKRNLVLLNILTYPILLIIAKFDHLFNFGWYRGFVIKAVKNG